MQLYLIRHTPVDLPSGICYGISDVPLANNSDMEVITQQFSNVDNPVVYASPLLRCRLLAEQLSDHVVYDDRLKELNFGKWELQSWDNIKGTEADLWMNDFVNVRCPEGESYIDLSERVESFFSDLRKHDYSEVIIVTHAGVIRTMLALLQNIPFQRSFDIQILHGQIIPVAI